MASDVTLSINHDVVMKSCLRRVNPRGLRKSACSRPCGNPQSYAYGRGCGRVEPVTGWVQIGIKILGAGKLMLTLCTVAA